MFAETVILTEKEKEIRCVYGKMYNIHVSLIFPLVFLFC